MSVDRLTHIRHNWQEKGNGPRGRDVDFLLGCAEAAKEAAHKLAQVQVIETSKEANRLIVHAYSGLIDAISGRDEDLALAALPATESVQPEEATDAS